MRDDDTRLPDRIRWNTDRLVGNRITLPALAVLFVGLGITWLTTAVCGNGGSPSGTLPTATPTGVVTQETALAATPTPTAAAEPATYPPETQTGIASVDSLILAVTSDDAAAILGRLAYVDVPCADSSNPIPGPSCPVGVAPGTLVSAFSRSGCEGTYEPAEFIGPVAEGMVLPGLRLFAVYLVEQPITPRTVPAGVYGVAFIGEFPGRPPSGPGLFVARLDSEGHIVHWHSSCGVVNPGDYLNEFRVAEFILPPLE